MNVIKALFPVFAILLLSEILWRKKLIQGEIARKFIHVLAGSWIAFWPYYLPFDGILILAIMMTVMVFYSRFTHLFHAINGVDRRTYGDIFYALGLVFSALVSNANWIFTVSVLMLSLADGAAALTGSYLGKKNTYYVFGYKYLKKSVIGTSTYLFAALIVMVIGWQLSGFHMMNADGKMIVIFLSIPVIATILENLTPLGIDNVAIPYMTIVLLNSLHG